VKVSVIGLGKIGLPLAVHFAHRGHDVLGADINPETVRLVNSAVEPFPGEHQLQERLSEVVAAGRLQATTDTTAAVAASEAVVVVVPLFVDADSLPDFAALDAATAAIGAGLRPGTLVSYETTLPVGTTRARFVPALEAASGLRCGEDFFVVFSPERVLTGRVFADLRKYPKLVGGVDLASTQRGVAFYSQLLEFDARPDLDQPNGVWDLGTSEASELAKLAETTYRDVNIALANQFALFAERNGIDIHKVIAASNSQPYSHIHNPGIAVGGHCIPVYPRLYLWNDPDATVVRTARAANAAMPAQVVARLEDAIGSLRGLRVAVLGAAYRGGVKETAFSGIFDVVDALAGRGAEPLVHDPLYSDEELTRLGFMPFHRGDAADAVIIQADHAEYRDWSAADVPGVQAVIDGRRMTVADNWRPARHLVIGTSEG